MLARMGVVNLARHNGGRSAVELGNIGGGFTEKGLATIWSLGSSRLIITALRGGIIATTESRARHRSDQQQGAEN
ncbi:MAG: hypothetical protein ACI9UK_001060 [Candidatus Krumholzibacteriia bacterium]|jgi:hypothetical protein